MAYSPRKDSLGSEGGPWTHSDPDVRRMAGSWGHGDKMKGSAETKVQEEGAEGDRESSGPALPVCQLAGDTWLGLHTGQSS